MKQDAITIDIPQSQFVSQSLFVDLRLDGISKFSIAADSTITVSDDAPDNVKHAAIVLTKHLQKNFEGQRLI